MMTLGAQSSARTPEQLQALATLQDSLQGFRKDLDGLFATHRIMGKFQVWQEVWQRIPKAELANIPRIFYEYSGKLGAKPPISQNNLRIFWEYWPAQPWGSSAIPLAIPGTFVCPLGPYKDLIKASKRPFKSL